MMSLMTHQSGTWWLHHMADGKDLPSIRSLWDYRNASPPPNRQSFINKWEAILSAAYDDSLAGHGVLGRL
jgi:hypothetical protein